MLFNWKLKILSPIVAVVMLFTMCPSTTFAKLTWLHEILEDRNHVPSVEDIKHIVSIHPEWLNEKDDDGHTPLDIAKANGLSEIVSFLSKSASSGDDQLSDFFTSFTHVPGKIATLEAQTEKLTIQMTEVTKEAAKTAPQVVESSKKIAALEAQIAELKQKQLATVEKRSKEAEEKAKKAEEKAAETAKSVPQVVGTALKPQIEELKRNQQGLEKRAKDAEERAKKAEERAAETVPTVVESSKKIAVMEPQIEELKKQIKSSQAEIADLRSLLTAVAKTMPKEVETGKKISALETQNEELKRQIKSFQTETTALRSQLAAVPKAATILSSAYPVGSIYMSINSTDPSTLFGGKWVRWGNGRVPVGIDSADTAFSTPEKTGGEKTHTLTVGEIPSHGHDLWTQANPGWCLSGQRMGNLAQSSTYLWSSTKIDVSAINSISCTGGNGAHNNLQPYITCYMWKRTA